VTETVSETETVDLSNSCLTNSTINCLYVPKLNIMELYKIGLKVKTDELTFLVCDELSNPGVVNFYGSRYEAGMYIWVYLSNGIDFQDIKDTLTEHFNSDSRKLANLNFWHSP